MRRRDGGGLGNSLRLNETPEHLRRPNNEPEFNFRERRRAISGGARRITRAAAVSGAYFSRRLQSFENASLEGDLIFLMDPIRTIRLRWVHGALNDVTYQLTRFHFSHHSPHVWQPAINAYRCETCIRICVELAGVDRSEIDLQIEPRQVWVRGERATPEPTDEAGRVLQTIAMEIDYGPFVRSVQLTAEIDVEKANATQENGFLWICLPLKKE